MSELALQKAVALALAGMTAPSETTSAATVGVSLVDHPPQNAAWPLVVLDDHIIGPAAQDTYDTPVYTHTLQLAVWSRYRGSRQVWAILAEMNERLHNARLVLEIGDCLSCRVTTRQCTREPDGTTYQGILTLTAIIA